jgi:hypothetical protein
MSERPYITTCSGVQFVPTDPTPEMISLSDIARGLAYKFRFAGQSPIPYTVAQHSIEVARSLASDGNSPAVCLWGLLHDAAEAYLWDVPRPIKAQQHWRCQDGLVSFDAIEARILHAVGVRFNLGYLIPPDTTGWPETDLFKIIDQHDRYQLDREQRNLFPFSHPLHVTENNHPIREVLVPVVAQLRFLEEFERFNQERIRLAAA